MNQLLMRARNTLFIVLFLISNSSSSFACHWSGGEIWYEFNGKNYTVHEVIYTACQTCIASFGTSGAQIEIKSASLNQTLNVTLKFYSKDTLMTGCAGDTNSCNSLLAPIAGYMKHHYADTISIPPANDWILSINSCCRNYSNLVGGSSNSIYVEATLDNSFKENTSALVSCDLALTSLINDTTYFPVSSNDADGDSVTLELVAPMESQSYPVTYSAGFSATMPLGAGSVCEFTSNHYLKIFNPNTYNPSFAMLVKEYRNGKLISSRIRDMQLVTQKSTTLSGKTHTTPPYIASGNNLSITTCPGKANSVMLSFLDSTATDIVDVDVITPNMPGWTFNKTITPGAGRADVQLSWNTPLNLTTLPQFFITLHAKDNECPNNTIDYVLAVKTDSCTADSVWPGDANNDNMVDMYDALAIALAHSETGAARTSPNTLWQPQTCASWGRVFPVDNTDMKHADCNGNGTTDNADLAAITNNYGNTHGRKKSLPVAIASTTNAPLFLDTAGIVFEAGKTLQIPIMLGTGAAQLNAAYGIATTIDADGFAPAAPLSISTTSSWLGAASNMISFSKSTQSSAIDWAYARITHTNNSGFGQIGTLTLAIPATTPDNTPLHISFKNTRIIDNQGRQITTTNIKGINTTVKNKLDVGQSNTILTAASIVPNPSAQKATLIVKLKTNATLRTDVMDITGRTVWTYQSNATEAIALPAQQLQSGIYFVKLTTDNSETLTLKWVKD